MRGSHQHKPRGGTTNPGAQNPLSTWGRVSGTCTYWMFLFHTKSNRQRLRGAVCDENARKRYLQWTRVGDTSTEELVLNI